MRTTRLLLWCWNATNLLLFVLALAHESTAPEVLSRYTRLYALFLAPALALLVLVLAISLFWRERIAALIVRIPVAWTVIAIGVMLVGTTVLWLAPFDALFIKLLITFNVVCLGMWSAFISPPDSPETLRFWQVILIGVLALMLIVALFSAHHAPAEQSSGDEAAWTDMAVTWLRTGQAYFRIDAWTPMTIAPGYGYWTVALAGWLNVFGISLASGRLFMWGVYALTVLAITAAGWRLYDRWAGLFAGLIAAGSAHILAARIIRPDLGLAAVGALLLWLYLRRQPFWALVAGLLSVIALEIHASALAYIVGIGGLYFTDLFLHPADANRFRRFGYFVIGGALAGALYIRLNILSLPDPGYFFGVVRGQQGFLAGYNWSWFRIGFSLYWSRAPLEVIFIALGLAGLVIRRTRADRLLLRFLAFTAVSYALLVPGPERYLVLFAPFFYLGIAALIRFGVEQAAAAPKLAGGALAVLCLSSPFLALSIPAMQPNLLAADAPPAHVQRVHEVSDAAAVVVGDMNDYWWFTNYAGFYANVAEYSRLETHQGDTGLWARIAPDIVYLTDYPANPEMAPLLKQWVEDANYTLIDQFQSDGLTTLIWQRPGYHLNS